MHGVCMLMSFHLKEVTSQIPQNQKIHNPALFAKSAVFDPEMGGGGEC